MGRTRQTRIPGTEPRTIKEVEDAAAHFRELRDAVKKLTEERDAARVGLRDAMEKNKLKVYKLEEFDPPEEVVIEDVEKEVKIRKVKMPAGDED